MNEKRFELARFLPYRIVALGQEMGQNLAREYADEFGLTIPEWRTLALIGQHERITAARVVADTPMDKATVSRAAARLVERGLVERVPHEEDRRSAVLRLSGEGAGIFARVSERALTYEERMLSGLTSTEQVALDSLLEKLKVATRESRKASSYQGKSSDPSVRDECRSGERRAGHRFVVESRDHSELPSPPDRSGGR